MCGKMLITNNLSYIKIAWGYWIWQLSLVFDVWEVVNYQQPIIHQDSVGLLDLAADRHPWEINNNVRGNLTSGKPGVGLGDVVGTYHAHIKLGRHRWW